MTTVHERIRAAIFMAVDGGYGSERHYEDATKAVIEAIGIPEEALDYVVNQIAWFYANQRPH